MNLLDVVQCDQELKLWYFFTFYQIRDFVLRKRASLIAQISQNIEFHRIQKFIEYKTTYVLIVIMLYVSNIEIKEDFQILIRSSESRLQPCSQFESSVCWFTHCLCAILSWKPRQGIEQTCFYLYIYLETDLQFDTALGFQFCLFRIHLKHELDSS